MSSRRRVRTTLLCALIAATAWIILNQVCFAQGTPAPATPPAATDQGTTPPAAPQATGPGPTAPAAPNQTPSAPAAPAPAAAPAAPKLALSGLFDFYYLWQLSNPNRSLLNSQSSLDAPIYDERFNTPSLSLAELNAALAPPANGGFGFKATFEVGDTADINHGGLGVGPNSFDGYTLDDEARYKNIQQLYVTDLAKSGWGADLGEFYTPFGYEVTESNGNYNYSRSDIFQLLLPVYHTGIRVYTPSIKGFVGTFYLVRSISDTATEGVNDDNHQPGYIGNFVYTDPKSKYTAAESIGYSEDKNTGATDLQPNVVYPVPPYTDKLTLSDTDFTYNLNPTNIIGLNYTYRKDDYPQGVPGMASNGYAAYYRNQFTKRNALALRYDTVETHQSGSGTFEPWEATVTLEDKPSGNFLTRLEYRHDGANQKIFADGSNINGSKQQDTISISEVYSFP